jgi:hypothetical protein
MSRFLRRDYCQSASFTTPQFAAYFALTIVDAHDVLEGFVADGVLTFVETDSLVETWAVSREGRYVFQERARRLKKEEVVTLKQAIVSVAPILAKSGAIEISIAGRPVMGKPNGTFIVGIRIGHAPFSAQTDEVLLNVASETLLEAVPDAPINVMLFHLEVPRRLEHRITVFQSKCGLDDIATALRVDADERAYDMTLASFLKAKRCGNDFMSMFHSGLPLGLRSMLAQNVEDAHYLAACRPSPVKLKKTLDVEPRNWEAKDWYEKLTQDDSMVAVHEVVARAEYFDATGQLERFNDTLTDEDIFKLGVLDVYLPPTEELPCLLEQAVRARRMVIRQKQATKKEKSGDEKRPPGQNSYYAFFDTISGPRPLLVGFVRQPASNSANIKLMERYWGLHVSRAPGSAAAYLASHGFMDGVLFLDRRPATAAEIVAYDSIGRHAKRALKTLMIVKGQACSPLSRYSKYTLELSELGPAPPALAQAELGRRVQPRLLFGKLWRLESSGVQLFDIVRDAPKVLRESLGRNLVELDSVDMLDFARKASLEPCIDPVVIATALGESWKFSTQKQKWQAVINAERWSVELLSTEATLHIQIQLDKHVHAQRLAPYQPEGRWGYLARPYQGNLSSLIVFMERIQDLVHMDVAASWAADRQRRGLPENSESLFAWFIGLVNSMLNGWTLRITEYDCAYHVDWPTLEVKQPA